MGLVISFGHFSSPSGCFDQRVLLEPLCPLHFIQHSVCEELDKGRRVCVITPQVVASTLGVPLVQHPVYPYDETPPFNDIMSLISGTTIQWGTDPRITSYELTKL